MNAAIVSTLTKAAFMHHADKALCIPYRAKKLRNIIHSMGIYRNRVLLLLLMGQELGNLD